MYERNQRPACAGNFGCTNTWLTRVEISQVGGDSETHERSAPAADVYDVGKEGRGPGTPPPSSAAAVSPFFREHQSTATAFVSELIRLGFTSHDAHDLVDGLVKGNALVTADAGATLDGVVTILKEISR